MREFLRGFVALCVILSMPNDNWKAAKQNAHRALRVSPNGRFLMHEDGTPFFYLGDTAWELFHRLTIDESKAYLDDRRKKGFNVIQSAILAELDGLNTPNADGKRPFLDNDPSKPNETYFQHVDTAVEMASQRGIFMAMLPTWGDKVTKAWGIGPVVFDTSSARAYGLYLGLRYRDHANIIWILGGDRDPSGFEQVWRAMAEGIKQGDGGHLMTYHPSGGHSSSEWFQKDDWLDFNLLQSGHGSRDGSNFLMVAQDYARSPRKPTIDGEPRYENHPVDWKPEQLGWFDDYDVRQAAYWAVFAGAAGHTYGCNDIWQMKTREREPMSNARGVWYDALDLPGASQMQYVRRLIESRPSLSRVPDQTFILENPVEGPDHMQGMRGDGYAFVYFPTGKPAAIATQKLSGEKLRAWWYDPRKGTFRSIGIFEKQSSTVFHPPGPRVRGNDWVLVLDDAGKKFSVANEVVP